MPSRVPLLLGTATLGEAGKHVTRVHTIPECQKIVDCFIGHGYTMIDRGRMYGLRSTENFLGQLDLKGGRVDTKAVPRAPGDLAPEKLRTQLNDSVKALGPHQVRVYYLHAPDRATPFEDTLRKLNQLYEEGVFEEIDLCNFNSWEVAEFVWLARKNGWKQPTIYQACYNALERMVELELIPCLRKYAIRFYAYSTLASGLLVGRILSWEDAEKPNSPRWCHNVGGLRAGMLRRSTMG